MRRGLPTYAVAIALSCAGLASTGLAGGGCRQNPPQRSPEARIAEAVDEKLAAWRLRRATECHRAALAEAQLLADTLVMDYALAKRLELARPSRPIRPEEPPLLRPDDTLRLAPFQTDTLIRAGELPRRRATPAPGAAPEAQGVNPATAVSVQVDSARADAVRADAVPVDSMTVDTAGG